MLQAMKNLSDFFFLEQVPKGYPMDVLYVNLGHVSILHRPEFGLKTTGPMVLIFEDGHYDIFLKKTEWFKTGEAVLNYIIESNERVSAWEKKTNVWLEEREKVNKIYKNKDFSKCSDKELAEELDKILELELREGFDNAEIMSDNYGTNLISQSLESVLKNLGFAPHAIAPILLRSTRIFPIIEYEKEVSSFTEWLLKERKVEKLTLTIIDEDKELSSRIQEILSKYDWLDASLASDPKSAESVVNNVNELLQFRDVLSQVLEEKKNFERLKKEERDRVVKEVLQKASAGQKRVINFAIESSELGRMLVDVIMQFLYYRRKIYKEIGKRLGVSEIEAKYLLPEEIKKCLLKNGTPDLNLIKGRQKLFVCVLENDCFDTYIGKAAEDWKNNLFALVKNDESPLKGEIAFSKGKVKGIARLVKDVHEMGKVKEGDVLVSSRTYPDLLPAMKRSVAIIAELGGLLSHAAIVSRELHIPCLVGVKNATSKIKDGDLLEIDTETGDIKIIEK